MAVHVRG